MAATAAATAASAAAATLAATAARGPTAPRSARRREERRMRGWEIRALAFCLCPRTRRTTWVNNRTALRIGLHSRCPWSNRSCTQQGARTTCSPKSQACPRHTCWYHRISLPRSTVCQRLCTPPESCCNRRMSPALQRTKFHLGSQRRRPPTQLRWCGAHALSARVRVWAGGVAHPRQARRRASALWNRFFDPRCQNLDSGTTLSKKFRQGCVYYRAGTENKSQPNFKLSACLNSRLPPARQSALTPRASWRLLQRRPLRTAGRLSLAFLARGLLQAVQRPMGRRFFEHPAIPHVHVHAHVCIY